MLTHGHPQTPLPVPRALLCLTPAHSMASIAPDLAPQRAVKSHPDPSSLTRSFHNALEDDDDLKLLPLQ